MKKNTKRGACRWKHMNIHIINNVTCIMRLTLTYDMHEPRTTHIRNDNE